MKRKIVKIDEAKCDGCGLCVPACAEGAIRVIDGKARLVSEIFCDGLGACLGQCPRDAIRIEEREAAEFDEEATRKHLAAPAACPGHGHGAPQHGHGGGCPGSRMRDLKPQAATAAPGAPAPSALGNWPVQLHLLPPSAPAFRGADLLLAADCVPFACAEFHTRLLPGHPVAIGCPKLDDTEAYVEKVTAILKTAGLRSLTVAHMEVPCCMGLVHVAREAIRRAGLAVPLHEITVGIDGRIEAS